MADESKRGSGVRLRLRIGQPQSKARHGDDDLLKPLSCLHSFSV